MRDWLDDLKAEWMPGDPVQPCPTMDRWLRLRHEIVTRLGPASIIEIGVRAGYSGFAMLSAAPSAAYLGIDIRTDAHGGRVGAHEHATAILARFPRTAFLHVDSRTMETLPFAPDLIHIDGDHSEAGCLSDLDLAKRSGAVWALVDDTDHIRAVGRAVKDYAARHGIVPEYHHDGHRGAALLRLG